MNIKTFLIENYIWIIVIILITIITIIGFLADKKKNDKKKAENIPANPNQNTVGQMQYNQLVSTLQNQMDNNIEQTNSIQNQMIEPINSNQNVIPVNEVTPIIPMTDPSQGMITPMNMTNNIQPIENVVPNIPQEQNYQPLSEQTPSFEPQPIPNIDSANNQGFGIPVDNGFNQNMNTTIPVGMPEQNIQQNAIPQPMMQNQMVEPMPNNDNGFFGPVPNMNQNMNTIPSPVNPIPTPQPVMPQPMMQNNQNMNNQMNYNMNQNTNTTIPVGMPEQNMQQNVMPQPMMQNPMNQQNNQMPMQNPNMQQAPVSFVFGPQNNNQNM